MKLVLLGDPVEHSLSPVIHTAGLDDLGIEGEYGVRRCDADGFRSAIAELRYGALDGANVTMPHKQIAFNLADRVDEDALRIGAVNTLVSLSGSVSGHNTDVAGIEYAWRTASLPGDRPVLILGAGGAAAAALVALSDRDLHVSARRPESARELCARTRIEASIVPWGRAVEQAVVINATPIGMHGESLPRPVVDGASGLLEMPYAGGATPAEVELAATGRPVAAGPSMLLGQAMASFTLWTGREAPEDAMFRALERARNHQAGF